MRIAVDMMGSESSPSQIRSGILEAAQELPNATLVVYVLDTLIPSLDLSLPNIEIVSVKEHISMTDSPLHSLRRKKDSSMVRGLKDLAEGKIDAFITMGNTGALMAGSSLFLSRLPKIERPALLASVPTELCPMVVIDVGGNVTSSPQQMIQFAQMGIAYKQCKEGVEKPRVGLLNIGTESIKGTENLRQVFQELSEGSESSMEFMGNIEGRDAFRGEVDVLVTEGFVGNVFLKTSEGVSQFIKRKIRALPEIEKSLNGFFKQFEYEEYPGALVCGVDGVVVKCHGVSDSRTILHAIRESSLLVESGFLSLLKESLLKVF